MKRIPVIIDCDPGIDDAVALLLAFRAPELDIRAITPVAGNVRLEYTSRNALKILALAGEHYPVCPGADHPICGKAVTADEVHGSDGLLGIPLPEPQDTLSKEKAWDVLYREATVHSGELEVIATAPLTNLAVALAKYPDLADHVKRIVLMGGSAKFGNTTPAAEFNAFADPEAAEMVFRSGIPVVMCGLDVTHKAYLSIEEIGAVRRIGSPPAIFSAQVMEASIPWHTKFNVPGAPMHDTCAVIYALDSGLFTSCHCWVGVERQGKLTRGKTVTDAFSDAKRVPNTELVVDVNRQGFVERVTQLLALY